MPRGSDWTGGLLPHEQARLINDVDGSGMAAHDAAEKTAATVVVVQYEQTSTSSFDQPGDDPRGLSVEALQRQTHVG